MELALEAATESPETEDLPEAAAGFAAFADPALPRQAGRFTLKTRLGVGGMGTVYEAEDASLRRTVALADMQALLPRLEKAGFIAIAP